MMTSDVALLTGHTQNMSELGYLTTKAVGYILTGYPVYQVHDGSTCRQKSECILIQFKQMYDDDDDDIQYLKLMVKPKTT